MAKIEYGITGVFYKSDAGERRCILDFLDYYGNLGAVAFHAIDREGNPNVDARHTMPVIVRELFSESNALANAVDNSLDAQSAAITIALVIRQSLLGYRPLKILEIGCNQGLLTSLLVRTAVAVHPSSRVYALSEDLYDDKFVDIISGLGDSLDNLSLLTTSLQSDMLRDAFFDVTIINGAQLIEAPEEVTENSLRVTRPGGYLVCLTEGDSWLRDCFTALPGSYEEYDISPDNGKSVLVKTVSDADQSGISSPQQRFADLCSGLKSVLAGDGNIEPAQLHNAVAILTEMEQYAIELFDIRDIDFKQRINDAKENALNALYTTDAEFRELCLERLIVFTDIEIW